jgi:hypothetical protein
MTESLTSFYVYILFRLNGIPCYVGNGKGEGCVSQPDKHVTKAITILRKPRLKSELLDCGKQTYLLPVNSKSGLSLLSACLKTKESIDEWIRWLSATSL